MPFNGAGVFNRVYSWAQDAANAINILASRMDTETTGIANGLSNCITRDGQSPAVANIPMGGFKITGVGDPAQLQDAATKSYVDAGGAFATSLASPTGATLVGSQAAGAGAQPRTVQDKLRDTISLTDYWAVIDADHTNALIRSIAALNAGGFRKLVIPSGDFNVDSAAWASANPTITRNGVSIVADKGATITITGTTVFTAFFHFVNCSGAVKGLTLTGNAAGTGYTNGCAVMFECNTSAAANIDHVEVTDCVFDNFCSPYWVYVYVSNATYGVLFVDVSDNRFTSRVGSTILAGDLGQRTAFICLQSKTAALTGGGGVSNITIRGNKGDATYIKSMLILSDFCRYALVDGNIVTNAGLSGATDDAGAYAFALYDSDSTGASDAIFTNNQALGVRSCGLYAAGLYPGLVVDGFLVRDQTDAVVATLPKGGVVLNGCRDFSVSNIVARNIAANGVYFIPAAAGFDGGLITGVKAYNCLLAAISLVSANLTWSGMRVSELDLRECAVGVSLNLVDSGICDNLSIAGFNIVSSVANSYGIRVFTSGAGKVQHLSIGGSSRVKTTKTGVDVSGLTYGRVRVNDVAFTGDFASPALLGNAATKLALDNLSFDNVTTGYCLSLAGSQGSLGLNLQFNDCDNTKLIDSADGTVMGASAPTWTANQGTIVRLVMSTSAAYIGWVNTDGAATWKTFGVIA